MPRTQSFLFRRKKTTLVAAFALVGVLAVVALRLIGANQPVEDRAAQETIGWPIRGFFGSSASAVMYRLGVPAKSTGPAPFEVRGPDGNMPEILSTSFLSKSSVKDIEQHYDASCQRLGLAVLPPEDAYAWEPDLYCDGYYKERSVGVYVSIDCPDSLCKVALRVVGLR